MTAQPSSGSLERFLVWVGLLTLGGILTFFVTIILGSIGVSFLVSGTAVFGAGVLDLSGAVDMGDSPIKAILVGPPLAAAGTFALAGLLVYFWMAFKVVKRLAG